MRDTATYVYVHLVWATWDRLPLLVGERKTEVYTAIQRECAVLRADVLALGGVVDHVHLLIDLPPTVSISNLVKQVKGASSHLASARGNGATPFKWQGAYGAFTLARQDVPYVRDYIQNQELHHRNHSIDPDLERWLCE
ncbi:MAG: IS200/IS605 family transposase [Capsulimonas sp.]|uniref:IS200/IS605 family transposase n=1 Tax=Capsulimonas sp. TaxID=2494211 RepID=UPI003262D21A